MQGLALEGGGARGAFHIGAVQALIEKGVTFDGVVGTSIGAINAAMIAQGDFERAKQWWNTVQTSMLFDVDDDALEKLTQGKVDVDALGRMGNMLRTTVENKGLDTARIRGLLEELLSEERIRQSPTEFGMVTVSATDLRPFELFKEDIPDGRMVDYVMASASLPVFRPQALDGKVYLDGGLYDNCPVNMLGQKGYERVYAVRTLALGRTKRPEYAGTEVITILPSEDLGPMLVFAQPAIQRMIKLGYFDAKRVLEGLHGIRYYLRESLDDDKMIVRLMCLPPEAVSILGEDLGLGVMEHRRMLFEELLPRLAKQLSLPKTASYGDIMLGAMEYLAMMRGVEKFAVYDIPTFAEAIRSAPVEQPPGILESLAQMLTVSGKLPSLLSDRTLRKAGRLFLDIV